jgi:hypothetical protein
MNADRDEDATITVRAIKSFEYKTCRNLLFHHLDLTHTTLGDLERMVWERIAENSVLTRLFPRTATGSPAVLDTFKLYSLPHAAKTNNPIINLEDDERLVLFDYSRPLANVGFQHEAEVSFFNWQAYEAYRNNPHFKWE